jgi:hypothetical protein
LRIETDQFLSKESIEFVEKLLFIDTAVDQYLDYLPLLLLFQVKPSDILEGLYVIFCTHYRLEDSPLHISIHVLFPCNLENLILRSLLLFFE